jgi:hypothetical protein
MAPMELPLAAIPIPPAEEPREEREVREVRYY